MSKKDQRFEFLLTKQERRQLKRAANYYQISQADLLRNMIREVDGRIKKAKR